MARETQSAKRERLNRVISLFRRYYPDAHCALHHETPEQLLIATALSAQCTDERVNKVTPSLFARYPTMKALAKASLEEIEYEIRSINFFRNKAKHLKGMAEQLVQDHGGRVPRDLKALVALPGVGRKTANVVLGNAFNIATGVVVDTHVQRLSGRLDLSRERQPVDIEQDLMNLVPQEDWVQFAHWLITHGRQVCKARNPACENCFLEEDCPQKMG